jgi:predicted TPR repeat methyltransferase
MLEDSGLAASRGLDVLDAGCGTGLCGTLVAPYARRLVGVDLSEGMLAQAKEKEVYDELVKAELTGFLRASEEAFDLIVSADTLVYFGSLHDVVAAAVHSLRPGGRLVFTLEHAVPGRPPADYRLEYHGRYSHSRAYVERVLAALAVQTTIAEAELRMESGVPVAGLVVRATKAS